VGLSSKNTKHLYRGRYCSYDGHEVDSNAAGSGNPLPIGDNFTMDIEDAIFGVRLCQCDKVLGYHYDTFVILKLITSKQFEVFDKGRFDVAKKESIEL
jgi:hypothetical protein